MVPRQRLLTELDCKINGVPKPRHAVFTEEGQDAKSLASADLNNI